MFYISNIKTKKLLLITTLSLVVSLIPFLICDSQKNCGEMIVLGTFCVFVLTIYILYRQSGSFFNAVILFLISFYVFQNGQLLISALKLPFYDYYYRLAHDYIFDISCFSSFSTLLACIASIASGDSRYRTQGRISRIIDKYDSKSIGAMSFLAFITVSVIIIPFMVNEIPIAINGGYDAIREYESSVNSFIRFFDFLFIPFSLLSLIFDNNKTHRITVFVLGYLYLFLTLFFGERTIALAGIIVFYFIRINWIIKTKRKNSFLIFLILGFILLVIIYFAGELRNKNSSLESISFFTLLTSSFSEIGFSFFPLYTMMKIVPSVEGYLLGKGYLASLIGGFLPASLDPTGTIGKITQYALIYHTWQDKYFDFNFGLGFSLNAEAYINFGWFGLIFIFILCIFIFRLLSNSDITDNQQSPFSFYIGNVMLFLIITLPRRGTYTLWNSICYGILFVFLFIICFCKKNNHHCF